MSVEFITSQDAPFWLACAAAFGVLVGYVLWGVKP